MNLMGESFFDSVRLQQFWSNAIRWIPLVAALFTFAAWRLSVHYEAQAAQSMRNGTAFSREEENRLVLRFSELRSFAVNVEILEEARGAATAGNHIFEVLKRAGWQVTSTGVPRASYSGDRRGIIVAIRRGSEVPPGALVFLKTLKSVTKAPLRVLDEIPSEAAPGTWEIRVGEIVE